MRSTLALLFVLLYIVCHVISQEDLFLWGTDIARVLQGVPAITTPTKLNRFNLPVVLYSEGVDHILAVTSDGKLWAMGGNTNGQLGDSTYNDALDVPVEVYMSGALWGKTIEQVYAGQYVSFVLTTDKELYGWGTNEFGDLGSTMPNPAYNIPVAVFTYGYLAGKTIAQFSFYRNVPLVLTTDNALYSWGYNGEGQIGDNTFDDKSSPYPVYMDGSLWGKTISKISTGTSWSMVLTSDGLLYAWGTNGFALGDGVSTMIQHPIQVGTTGALAGKTVVDFAMQNNGAIVLASDGNLYAWGRNNNGALGDGTTTNRVNSVPVVMTAFGGRTISQIRAGFRHTIVLTTDNTLFTWGRNTGGWLSVGTSTDQTTPIQVIKGAMSGYSITRLGAATDSSFTFACNQPVDNCGVCGGDGSSCAPPPCVYDVCGVCGGDGSSCDTGPIPPITSDVQLNQKTYCSIVESGSADIDNPFFTLSTTSSKTATATTTFSYSCASTEARNRIDATTSTTLVSIEGVSDFYRYQSSVSLSDLNLCNEAVNADGKLAVLFPVITQNSNSQGVIYSASCNYLISRNELEKTYSVSYDTRRFGFTTTLKSYEWEGTSLNVQFQTDTTVMGSTQITISPSTVSMPSITIPLPTQVSSSCDTDVCRQVWSLTGIDYSSSCISQDVSMQFTVNGNGYTGLDNMATSLTLHLDVCRPEQDDAIDLPVPSNQLLLYSDTTRSHPATTFVHGNRMYGSMGLTDCDTFDVTITKIEAVCAATEGEWLTTAPNVVYDLSSSYTGGATYSASVLPNSGCRSKVDFDFISRVIRAESSVCRLGVFWKYSNGVARAIQNTAVVVHVMDTHTSIQFKCPSGSTWSNTVNDCVVSENGSVRTVLIVCGSVLLLVAGCLIGLLCYMLGGQKKDTRNRVM
jgi:alpha-tubulin suppressor-like RCC1 family protein